MTMLEIENNREAILSNSVFFFVPQYHIGGLRIIYNITILV